MVKTAYNEKDLIKLEKLVESMTQQLKSPAVKKGHHYKKAIDPNEAEGLYAFGLHYYEHGKYKEAADFFTVLTTINGHNSKYWSALAAASKMLREYEKALEEYAVAIHLSPGNPYSYFYAADCYFALGMQEEGINALDKSEFIADGDKKYEKLLIQLALIREAWYN